ncbi:MAG TPA: hypothetical protein VI934_01640 [Candidatus Nanoarchaeia archaeon]|nr:hypothetical protein [Candidatus Nanoarchaeia archaeon]
MVTKRSLPAKGDAWLSVFGKTRSENAYRVIARSNDMPHEYAGDIASYAYLGTGVGTRESPEDLGYAFLRPNAEHVMWVRYHGSASQGQGVTQHDALVFSPETFANKGYNGEVQFPFGINAIFDSVNLGLDNIKIEPRDYSTEEEHEATGRLQELFAGKRESLTGIISAMIARKPVQVIGGRDTQAELIFMENFSHLFLREQRAGFTYAVRPMGQERLEGKVSMFTCHPSNSTHGYFPAFDVRDASFNPNYQQDVKLQGTRINRQAVQVPRKLGPVHFGHKQVIIEQPVPCESWGSQRFMIEPRKRALELSNAFLNSSPGEYYAFCRK